MNAWITYSHQNFPVGLKYPNPTPLGNVVTINEQSGPSRFRAHFVSSGSDEVYFEVGSYVGLTVTQAIDDFLTDISGRFENLEVGEMERITFKNFSAHRFSIRWPGKERVILFIEKEDALYRIIHDPASPINGKMLDSLEFREGD